MVQTQGIDIVGYREKPVFKSLINASVYVLDSRSLELLGASTLCDMASLLKRISIDGSRILAFPIHEKCQDIGNPQDLSRAQAEINLFNTKRIVMFESQT